MSPTEKKYSIIDTIEFYGHPNILGTHYNTIEVTKEAEISKRADCIIGVSASKACADLIPALRTHIRAGGNLVFEINVNDSSFAFEGKGRRELELTDSHELVLRKSDFVSDRTAAISCSAAAIDLPRKMIKLLQNKRTLGTLTISALDLPTSSDTATPLFIGS